MSVTAKVGLARGIARVSGLWLAGRLAPDQPVRPGGVPSSTATLTTEWLTHALCAGQPEARVIDFKVGARTSGTCAREPLKVTYNEAGSEAGLPTDLYVKSSPT